MQDLARQKLTEIIIHYGTILTEDAERCEYLLTHACGNDANEHKREIFVLIHAIKTGIVKQLLNSPVVNETLFETLVEQLQADFWLDKKAAEWAVETWKMVLQGKVIKPVFEDNPTEFTSPPNTTITQTQLSPFNPLHYFQLLWWVLVSPRQLKTYRAIFGQDDEKRVGNWLVSNLIWWPLLLPSLALGLEQWPLSAQWQANIYLLFTGLFLLAWLFTGGVRITKDVTITLGILMSIFIGVGVAIGIAIILLSLISINFQIALLLSIALFIITIIAGLVAVIVASDIVVIISILVAIGIAVGAAGGILISNFILAFVAASFVGFIAIFLVNFLINLGKNTITETLKTGRASSLARFAFLLLSLIILFLISLYFSIKLHIF
jgi:hypothetical protein